MRYADDIGSQVVSSPHWLL